mmetsp:Transcript_69007/g.195617  ORF Transcript_69007/g.195617 Transcript_69007/m.195617 type:complete len:238 (-) Transcript_69007:19-732(-)
MCPHQGRLAPQGASFEVFQVEAELLRKLLAVPAVDGLVHRGGRGVVGQHRYVDGLVAQRAQHPDVSPLDVPAPVHWPRAQLEALPNRLPLAVVLVAHVALGARGLSVRAVADLGLRAPPGDELVRLVPVGALAAVPHEGRSVVGHVVWLRPFLPVGVRLILPPLLLAHDGLAQGRPKALDVPFLHQLRRGFLLLRTLRLHRALLHPRRRHRPPKAADEVPGSCSKRRTPETLARRAP